MCRCRVPRSDRLTSPSFGILSIGTLPSQEGADPERQELRMCATDRRSPGGISAPGRWPPR